MALAVVVGGLPLVIEAAAPVLQAVAVRWGAFAAEPTGPSVVLEVHERPGGFAPEYEALAAISVRVCGSRWTFEGAAHGWYDTEARRGVVEDATGVGAIDALFRVALSTTLPLTGGLLLHAAALPDGVALCGASGAGKSTAAAALGGACDEMVVARCRGDLVDLCSTPYWRGQPLTVPLRRLVCLHRGAGPSGPLRGSRAIRELLRHVVRYAFSPALNAEVLRTAVRVCSRVPIEELSCPEGSAYLPFLVEHLGRPA